MTESETNQIVIYATSMLNAQGTVLTAEQRSTLVAKADRFRAITETTGKTQINVPVLDIYSGVRIGSMGYCL